MDATAISLQPVLVLLAVSVLAVVACRSLALPPVIGYLASGVLLGALAPSAGGIIPTADSTQVLAEVGVVFLMFSIGLEFSLPKLVSMRRVVFGLGLLQVAITLALALVMARMVGASWQLGLVVGGAAAMSSTAIVSKLLAERLELETAHGRAIIGVLLFQDLAVVPLVILVPALGQPPGEIGVAVVLALVKAMVALGATVLGGPRLMRAWLGLVARRRSTELFVLNVLFITLALAFFTGSLGLSLPLGAFLAGMLISETEYRFQVEEDIKPFRDVLLGLFFVTVGMRLELQAVAAEFWLVATFFVVLTALKCGLIAALARAFAQPAGTAIRVGLALAQGGEFGFVLLALAGEQSIGPAEPLQALLAAMILSMIAAPFVIASSDRIVLRFSGSEWMMRSLELHRIAVESIETERHVVILGYGRNGQRLARLLESENVRYVALDLDPDRVREAARAGDAVVFADCSRREALVAAGIARAAAAVITFADAAAATRVLAHAHALNPSLPVIVRAHEERDIERLTAAGASEVVPEAFESGLMLALHTLVWVGVPLNRVMRRMRRVRDSQYGLMRGFFHGAGDEADSDAAQPRLRAVTLGAGAYALGWRVDELGLGALGVQVKAVRRLGAKRKLDPEEAGTLVERDVVVLLGVPEVLAAAEKRLIKG